MTPESIYTGITKLEYRVTELLSEWLERMLPALGEDWWNEAVIDNLSYYQQQHVTEAGITKLSELDLAALLRIADRNWFSLTRHGVYLTQSERFAFKDMYGVRNNWAHCPAVLPPKEKILDDIRKIRAFATALDSPRELFTEIDKLTNSIESSRIENISTTIDSNVPFTKPSAPTAIDVQSIVRLVKNPDSKGVVMAVSSMVGGTKYTIFIDGSLKTFYQDQIELVPDGKQLSVLSLQDIVCRLTAYQLSKPSSSNLYSLNAARIDFVPYQFRPALKIIRSDVPRLLIADSVGVGKTIEAGLILKELQAMQSLDNYLIICPKPLVAERKWELEMRRFGENFTPISGTDLPIILRDCSNNGEWPEKYSRAIIPYSILDKDHLSLGGRTSNGELGIEALDPPPHFDLLIVDEAHHIRNSDTVAYKAVRYFADNSDAVVFLTATPVQMGNRDLYTLLNLLRPDLIIDRETFMTMAEPNCYINRAVHLLRSAVPDCCSEALNEFEAIKETLWGENVTSKYPVFKEIEDTLKQGSLGRKERVNLISEIEELNSFSQIINRTRRKDIGNFCIRRSETVSVYFTDEQQELYDKLIDFISDILSLKHDSRLIRFMTTTLRRQAASSIFGLAPALRSMISNKLSDFYDDIDFTAADISGEKIDFSSFRKRGEELIRLAESISTIDPKFEKLLEVVNTKNKSENNKIMIFSSFRHTLSYIKRNLQESDFRVGEINGSVGDAERMEIRNRFALPKTDPQALDIVLFTEVGSEGLDYQFCDMMINYDLPWNPMRIEQRIGRIDRRGQKSEFVTICNLITEDTIDADIFHRCLERIGVFEESIGDCDEILGDVSFDFQATLMDPDLSESERRKKIEQIADNEVRKVQALKNMETEENELLAFDFSTAIDSEVQKAENIWITPDLIQNMITNYLNAVLGEKQYFQGSGAGLSLRISYEGKQKIKEELRQLDNRRNSSIEWKEWEKYLKSHSPNVQVTFDSDYASANPNVIFFTPTHPLVRLSAEYYSETEDVYLGIKIVSSDIPAGEYPFAIYSWKYSGLKMSKKLVPFCCDTKLESSFFDLLQGSEDSSVDFNKYSDSWNNLEQRQFSSLSSAIATYKNECHINAEIKIASLSNSHRNKISIFEQRLSEAQDPKLITMYQAMLNKENSEFQIKSKAIENEGNSADIYSEKIVSGVMLVYTEERQR